ncbi:MAG TPA: ZIP family metal transporter [Acidobacteriaceae bacterium]|nr:ZIP family metal transporter [Acidobacteriaceae bacterium]
MLLSLILGSLAAVADIIGGLVLVRRNWTQRYLRYSIALGAGFMMAVAILDMLPESFEFSRLWAPILVLVGYCIIHLLEHTITGHFHFGEETHKHEFLHAHTGWSVLAGLAAHAFFDGVAIASGFVISRGLGWMIFVAIILHKVPEGFTIASVMLASGRSRRTAVYSAIALAAATIAGVLIIGFLPGWVQAGLPLSAGVAIYVAASDLVPEVNREPGIRVALVFFLGVGLFVLVRLLAPI